MRFTRKIAAVTGGLLATGVMALAAATAAPAGAVTTTGHVRPAVASNEICGNFGNGYCLNSWNGGVSGSPVKMYYGGNYVHDHFVVVSVDACGGGAISTSTCPFSHSSLNNAYKGQPVVEYQYQGTNLCIATNGSGQAVLGTCDNAQTGTGGANGVLFVEWPTNSCAPPDATPQGLHYAINRYWSDADGGQPETLQSGGNPGVQAYLDYGGFNTCWGVN